MHKILHLVLAANTEHYKKIERAANETWNLNKPDNVTTVFLYGGSQTTFFDGSGSFFVNKKEGLDICLYKTLCAFEFFLQNDFDYIFRSNITGYFDYQVINEFIRSKATSKFYCGIKGKHRGIPFASGSGFFLSRDLVENIVQNKTTLHSYQSNLPDGTDDVAIGKYLIQDLKIDVAPLARRLDLTPDQINASLDMTHYHYRVVTRKEWIHGKEQAPSGDGEAIREIHKLKNSV